MPRRWLNGDRYLGGDITDRATATTNSLIDITVSSSIDPTHRPILDDHYHYRSLTVAVLLCHGVVLISGNTMTTNDVIRSSVAAFSFHARCFAFLTARKKYKNLSLLNSLAAEKADQTNINSTM